MILKTNPIENKTHKTIIFDWENDESLVIIGPVTLIVEVVIFDVCSIADENCVWDKTYFFNCKNIKF